MLYWWQRTAAEVRYRLWTSAINEVRRELCRTMAMNTTSHVSTSERRSRTSRSGIFEHR